VLLCAFAAKFLPYGVILSRAGLRQMPPELTDSARMSGAGPLRSMVAITLRLIRPALATAMIFVMLNSVRELSASVLLTSQDSAVLSVLAWHYMDAGDYQFAAAIAVVQTLILLALVGLAQGVLNLRLDRALVAGGGR
jgi:iron(III) transport system permease protein